MLEPEGAQTTTHLPLHEAIQITERAFFLARGSEQVSNDMFGLLHFLDPTIRLQESHVGAVTAALTHALDTRIANRIHPEIPQQAHDESPLKNVRHMTDIFSGDFKQFNTYVGGLQDLISEMAVKDLEWLRGEREGGKRSRTTTSRLCEYIIGVGNPPSRKDTGNKRVNTVLQKAHMYLWSISLDEWVIDMSNDVEDLNDPFSLVSQELQEVRETIDLYNGSHEIKTPYPPLIETVISS